MTKLGVPLLSVTERDWRPRYIQLAEALRDQIDRGQLPPGSPLRSETDLADSYAMSRTSVRQAIKLLRDWGLVTSEQGRGTFVRKTRHRVRRENMLRYQREKDAVLLDEAERRAAGGTEQDTGLSTGDLEFHAEYQTVPADADLAARFQVPEGTQLLERRYWTTPRAEDAPLSMSRSYLLHEIAAKNPDLLDQSREPWPGGTQHQLSTVGIELDRIVDEVTARPPRPREAEILRVEHGVSVVVLWKTSTDLDGRVVEVAEVIFPGDRTTMVYDVKLNRWDK